MSNISPEIVVIDGTPRASSLDIAAHFDKSHADVLKAIRKMMKECPAEFREGNFSLTFRIVAGPNNSKRREGMYQLSRDGFALLAMGFTGPKAMRFKIAYIEAFNAMEAELTAPKALPAPKPKPKRGRPSIPAHDSIEAKIEALLARVGFYVKEIARAEKEASDLLAAGYGIRTAEENKSFHDFIIHVACTTSALWTALDFNLRAIEGGIKARLAVMRS